MFKHKFTRSSKPLNNRAQEEVKPNKTKTKKKKTVSCNLSAGLGIYTVFVFPLIR